MRVSQDDYCEWVKTNRPEFKVLGTYVNIKTKILHVHTLTSTLWNCTPNKFKNYHNPPSFTNNDRITNESYDKFLIDNNIELERVGNVTRKMNILEHKSTSTGVRVNVRPSTIYLNRRYDISKIRNKSDYVMWLKTHRPEYELIGEYTTSHTKTIHKHIPTGVEWNVKPNNIQQGQCSPHLSTNGYSKRSIQWMNFISQQEGIDIQHAENGGEYTIPNVGKVDGYNADHNIVFEYHGDFWHGNPAIYNPTDTNPISHKTYGQLYEHTKIRDNNIVEQGYTLITIWDSQLDYILQP